MAARKKGPPRVGDEADPSEKPVKRPTPLGPELALTLPTTQGKALELSYWDLWFALVAVTAHDGDLHRLAERIKNERGFFYDRDSIERKRWHLRDLNRRLGEVSVTPSQIVNASGDLARTEKRRAITKVAESCGRANA